jgi:steroid 5-alpha reductase family enzyme
MSNIEGIKFSFITDRLIVLLAYTLAIFGAWVSMQFFPDHELWIKIAIADFAGTVIIFISSSLLKNSSMYDPYWSVVPIIILIYLFFINGIPLFYLRFIMISIIVVWWGVRLTGNWLKTWPGLNHEDWRYIKLAKDSGKFYWPVSFLGIHLLPTIVVFFGCLPLIPIVFSDAPVMWTDFLGFFIALFAIEIERRADNQLRKFKKENIQTNDLVCDVGLWKYSRHPNYFGEIIFWGGIFVMAYGLNPTENLYYGTGFLSMVILFVLISIPMMEKRQMHKEGYTAYRRQVSMLVPWFRKS